VVEILPLEFSSEIEMGSLMSAVSMKENVGMNKASVGKCSSVDDRCFTGALFSILAFMLIIADTTHLLL
jgi:hypothetical protein